MGGDKAREAEVERMGDRVEFCGEEKQAGAPGKFEVGARGEEEELRKEGQLSAQAKSEV